MRILIKLGGTLLDEPVMRREIARQLVQVSASHRVIVVHGGGKQVTHFLEERGVASRFVGGLRVSDQVVIDAVTQIIAGRVNKQLVAALIAAGRPALGLSGVDGSLTEAVPLSSELQFVGKPQATNGALLDLLLDAGYLPVIACIAGDRVGNIYNVNADQMAASCAAGWRADKLLFLTDVPGVKNGDGQITSQLSPAGIRNLTASGVAYGGMQAKLEAALWAIESGLPEVIIASGEEPEVCSRLVGGEHLGTLITSRCQWWKAPNC